MHPCCNFFYRLDHNLFFLIWILLTASKDMPMYGISSLTATWLHATIHQITSEMQISSGFNIYHQNNFEKSVVLLLRVEL